MKVVERNATVWKVVTAKNGKLLSALEMDIPSSWVVRYRPGHWAYPTQAGSALFAFQSRRAARDWSYGTELWRAKADIVTTQIGYLGRILRAGSYALEALAAFWFNPVDYASAKNNAPDGGLWCKRIKLEKRV